MDSDTRSRWCAGVGGALIDLYFSGARSDMNRVVHFEIPADNQDRAKKFYGENFGWKLNQLGPEMGSYVLIHTGPTDEKGMPQDKAFINGGLMIRDPSASSTVIVIV
jgi:predicted enzyme related to lactoylglutathione lyase